MDLTTNFFINQLTPFFIFLAGSGLIHVCTVLTNRMKTCLINVAFRWSANIIYVSTNYYIEERIQRQQVMTVFYVNPGQQFILVLQGVQ